LQFSYWAFFPLPSPRCAPLRGRSKALHDALQRHDPSSFLSALAWIPFPLNYFECLHCADGRFPMSVPACFGTGPFFDLYDAQYFQSIFFCRLFDPQLLFPGSVLWFWHLEVNVSLATLFRSDAWSGRIPNLSYVIFIPFFVFGISSTCLQPTPDPYKAATVLPCLGAPHPLPLTINAQN